MLHADAPEGFDQYNLPAKPSCAAPDSTEASLEALNPKELSKVTNATSGPDEPETMSSPENLKSPQRLKKAGIDAPATLLSPQSANKPNPETQCKSEDGN